MRRLPLGKGRERQALQAVDGAPLGDSDERARALEPVGILVQIRVQPRYGRVRHPARLARHGRVVRRRHLLVVLEGRPGAPLVHLRLRHQDLAVVPARGHG